MASKGLSEGWIGDKDTNFWSIKSSPEQEKVALKSLEESLNRISPEVLNKLLELTEKEDLYHVFKKIEDRPNAALDWHLKHIVEWDDDIEFNTAVVLESSRRIREC